MVPIAKLIAILPAFIAYTAAAPVQASAGQIWAGSTYQPCKGGADTSSNVQSMQATQGIVAWANAYSQNWQQPTNTQARVTATLDGPSHLVLDYTLLFEQCGKSEVVARAATTGPGLYCSSDVKGGMLYHLSQ